ncbi:hypothetical protein NI17_011380 [Thermobifida halotolerans]|uniref:Uncharacterized protein n=1 Tax=Thermobifida halotolerans TaxID=483545 RepID=A0A399G9P8_9ACTN|nr:hypothetical protein [Thermobifida halotolerans]UOE21641.1 hypothetical protein NI17_011380 [Thermobifida halotolerans]
MTGYVGYDPLDPQIRFMEELEAARHREFRREMDTFFWVVIGIPLFVLGMVARGVLAGAGTLAELLAWLASDSLLAPLFPAPGDSLARGVLSVLTLLLLIPGPVFGLAALLRGTRLAVLRWALVPLWIALTVLTPLVAVSQLVAEIGRLPS